MDHTHSRFVASDYGYPLRQTDVPHFGSGWYSARYHRPRLIIITDEGRGGEEREGRVARSRESRIFPDPFTSNHSSREFINHRPTLLCIYPLFLSPRSRVRSLFNEKGERNEIRERYVLEMETCLTVDESTWNKCIYCVSSFPRNYPSFYFRNFGNFVDGTRMVLAQPSPGLSFTVSFHWYGKIWNSWRYFLKYCFFVRRRELFCVMKNNIFVSYFSY